MSDRRTRSALEIPEYERDKRAQTIQAGKWMIERAIRHETELRQEGNLGFLTKPAFLGVGLALFAIWGTMIYFLNKWGKDASDETDTAKVDHALHRLGQISGPGIIIYAITITAASTQWVMSLQAGWASTMFPVIFAINQFLTCFAFCLAMFLVFVTQAAAQKHDAPEVPARHGHPASGLHSLLVVYVVLAVHARVDRQPAGRDPVLPEAFRRRDGGTSRRR